MTRPHIDWPPNSTTTAAVLVVGVAIVAAFLVRAARRPHPAKPASPPKPTRAEDAAAPTVPPAVMVLLIGVAVIVAAGVAGLGGVRSFDAVSQRFGSPAVPLTADGMIVACTALRLAALARGWRLPGSLLITYVFIAGTVRLNIDAATSGTDKIAHALAPVSYAALVEMLAHILRHQLELTKPSGARITALTWATSPVVTTRVWLHLARTGDPDPAAARALVQQLLRMSSRLRAVCPNPHPWWPLGTAHAARTAAVHTVRDGLLPATALAALLPAGQATLTAGQLLALVDNAALQIPAGLTSTRQQRAGAGGVSAAAVSVAQGCIGGGVPAGVPGAVSGHVPGGVPGHGAPGVPVTVPDHVPAGVPVTPGQAVPDTPNPDTSEPDTSEPEKRPERSDAELLAVMADWAAPVGLRATARELEVGVNRARRLLTAAGLRPPKAAARAPRPAGNSPGPVASSGRPNPPPDDQPDDDQPDDDQPVLTLVPATRTDP
jgi:hypothetical protein